MPWLFLLLPWIELWTLIELGSATSALTALAEVFLTLVLGLALVRRQGMQWLADARRQGELFGPQLLMDELSVVSCGLLLMVPGLVTDTVGLVLLIGPLRRRLLRAGHWETEIHVETRRSDERVTLDGEYRRMDD